MKILLKLFLSVTLCSQVFSIGRERPEGGDEPNPPKRQRVAKQYNDTTDPVTKIPDVINLNAITPITIPNYENYTVSNSLFTPTLPSEPPVSRDNIRLSNPSITSNTFNFTINNNATKKKHPNYLAGKQIIEKITIFLENNKDGTEDDRLIGWLMSHNTKRGESQKGFKTINSARHALNQLKRRGFSSVHQKNFQDLCNNVTKIRPLEKSPNPKNRGQNRIVPETHLLDILKDNATKETLCNAWMTKGGFFGTGYSNDQYAWDGYQWFMKLMNLKNENPFSSENLGAEKAQRLEWLKEILHQKIEGYC